MTRAERSARARRWWKRARDRERQRRIYRERRALALRMLGGCCAVCGEREDLQIDHVDPTLKRLEFCQPHRAGWLEELENAQLLCYGCHLEKTRGDRAAKRLRNRAWNRAEAAPF